MTKCSPLTVLRDACSALIATRNDFWIIAGLTDWSFETGGSRKYRKAVQSFKDAGLNLTLTSSLFQGVNGNLESLIRQRGLEVGIVQANKGRGTTRPDICFGSTADASETVVEVKAVFDMTIPSFYGHKDGHGVSDDRDKQILLRKRGFPGSLFQIVFFLQLPRFHYPSGAWYPPNWKKCEYSRDQFRGFRGIAAQYQQLRKHLPEPPVWPAAGPEIVYLQEPQPDTLRSIGNRFQQVFRPDGGSWEFLPGTHLESAAASFAIWEY